MENQNGPLDKIKHYKRRKKSMAGKVNVEKGVHANLFNLLLLFAIEFDHKLINN